MEERELVIIGGGPAGMSAAVYGRRAGLDVLVLEKGNCGGQILITSEIENYLGQSHSSGPDLANSFRAHAEHFGAEIRKTVVKEIVNQDGVNTVVTKDGDIRAKAVIVATGAAFRRLGAKGEKEFSGAGVSYCAVCDAAFYQDEVVAVIGGGNTAVEEACYLTQFASKVYIVHRRDEFRADKMACERASCNAKIEPIWNSVLESVNGSDLVESITVKNVKTGEFSDIEVAGVFVFVGTLPITECLGDLCERLEDGWIVTDQYMATSVPGIFAAGDVRNTPLRQVITAASDGAIAAMSAYHWLATGQAKSRI